MTALTRWNPFAEMDAMQNRLFSSFGLTPVRGAQSPSESQWAPFVDVIETGDEYIIRADLPGVTKDDLSVTLENGQLLIRGKRPAEALREGAHYLHNEVPYGAFSRWVALPSDADAGRIDASFNSGVLTVRVAKDEKAKPRLITINGGE